jgi:putative transcriptional regulator
LIGIKNPEKVETIINKLVHRYTQKDGVSEELKGYIFEDTDLAFDQFMAYIISKMNEGDDVKNRIKELRSDRGITQQDLAEKVDVTRQTIHYLEKGTYNPSLKLDLKIAKVFGITIEELFELEDEE